jgi:hypothetical protein
MPASFLKDALMNCPAALRVLCLDARLFDPEKLRIDDAPRRWVVDGLGHRLLAKDALNRQRGFHETTGLCESGGLHQPKGQCAFHRYVSSFSMWWKSA